MFEFLRNLFNPAPPSSTTAKERLRLVLLSDHLSLAPDVVLALKKDLLAVISRYVEIDSEHADVTFEHRERDVAMLANIPITGVRDRVRPETPAPAPVVPMPVTETAIAGSVSAELVAAEAVAARNSMTQSRATESPVASIPIGEASVAETSVAETAVAETRVAEASVAENSVAEVSVAETRVAEMSAMESRVTEPSASDAPLSDEVVAEPADMVSGDAPPEPLAVTSEDALVAGTVPARSGNAAVPRRRRRKKPGVARVPGQQVGTSAQA